MKEQVPGNESAIYKKRTNAGQLGRTLPSNPVHDAFRQHGKGVFWIGLLLTAQPQFFIDKKLGLGTTYV